MHALTHRIRVTPSAPGEDLHRYVDECVKRGDLDAALDLSVVEFDELAQLANVAVTAVNPAITAAIDAIPIRSGSPGMPRMVWRHALRGALAPYCRVRR